MMIKYNEELKCGCTAELRKQTDNLYQVIIRWVDGAISVDKQPSVKKLAEYAESHEEIHLRELSRGEKKVIMV